MDDTLFVCGFKCVRNLPRDTQCFAQRHRTIRRTDEFHHQILGTHVVERTDVGMVHAATARPSCSKRSLKRSAETLIATFRPSRESRAKYTSPIPPGVDKTEDFVRTELSPDDRAIRSE